MPRTSVVPIRLNPAPVNSAIEVALSGRMRARNATGASPSSCRASSSATSQQRPSHASAARRGRHRDTDLDAAVPVTIETDLAHGHVALHPDQEAPGGRGQAVGEPPTVVVGRDRLGLEARRPGDGIVRPLEQQGPVGRGGRSEGDRRRLRHPGLRAMTLTNVASRSSIVTLG